MVPTKSSSFTFASLLLLFVLLAPKITDVVSADDGKRSNQVDFNIDIVPILTKMGCNAGSCHGSAAGRGGFKLSLYGSRPDDDFLAIARQDKGRRINRFKVEKSLILRKPGGETDHGGDQLFDLRDKTAQSLADWIKQGAKRSDGKLKLVQFDIGESPLQFDTDLSTAVAHGFQFRATFSNGETRDVTDRTVVTSNDSSSVKVDTRSNKITVLRPGRHILIARFLDRVKPIEVLVPFYKQPVDNTVSSESFIDELISEKLGQLNIPTGPKIGDAAFLRRVSLDLNGRLPSPKMVEDFHADDRPDKRERLINNLLSNEAFADYWTYRIATQLRIRSQNADKIGARTYHRWLRNQISENRSWKGIANDLVLSSGDTHSVGPANFYRTTGDARLQAEFFTEALLGVKLRCANCHNHPLDHWTQDDYHGLAAVFAKIKQGRVISRNPSGENIHARTGKPARVRVPGSHDLENSANEIAEVSKWMLDDDNPYFARSMVNRIWQALMGRGLIEPVDDLRNTNPATHSKLLKRLAEDFVVNKFDIRNTIRTICNSEAYQRSVGETDTPEFHRRFYANASIRALPPEVLADAICDATGVFEKYPDFKLGTRAVQIYDPKTPSESLDVLGRCSREESCEADTQAAAGGLSTQLHLLNSGFVNKKIANEKGILNQLGRKGHTTEEIINVLYVRSYGRTPSEGELRFWLKKLRPSDSGMSAEYNQRLEDFFWSLLNSKEFTTNH